jgi:hypothetical protein
MEPKKFSAKFSVNGEMLLGTTRYPSAYRELVLKDHRVNIHDLVGSALRSWTTASVRPDQFLYLTGGERSGKTILAGKLLLAYRQDRMVYVTCAELSDAYVTRLMPKQSQPLGDLLARCYDAPMLVIDDIGPDLMPEHIQALQSLLGKRRGIHEARTILCSRLPLTVLSKSFSPFGRSLLANSVNIQL